MTRSSAAPLQAMFRFSLRVMLSVTAIALLSLSYWNTSRELESAKETLWLLRLRSGALLVDDPARLHVAKLWTFRYGVWKLYVPAGSSYRLSAELKDFAGDTSAAPLSITVPATTAEQPLLGPGEWIVHLETDTFVGDVPNELWRMTVSAKREGEELSFEYEVPMARVPWTAEPISWKSIQKVAGARGKPVASYGPKETVDLLVLYALPDNEWRKFWPDEEKAIEGRLPNLMIRLTPSRTSE